jgi:riboflavin kinase
MRKINGRVVTGIGEGKYYVSREGYRKQFNQKLGFDPVPGTLNLKLDEPFTNMEEGLIKLEGFRDGDRIFGRCTCYLVQINGIKAAIVRPEISSYPPDQIEVIAPIHLRGSLNLVEGDLIELMLE